MHAMGSTLMEKPTARSGLCANDYAIGGQIGDPEIYDVSADTWTTKKSLNTPLFLVVRRLWMINSIF
jgi:hypothetical protein